MKHNTSLNELAEEDAKKQRSKYPDEGFSFEEKDGRGYACSVSTEIRTLVDLLAYAKVDQEIWEVERYVINKWDMGFKNKNTQEASTIPLYQIKAWLRRRKSVEFARNAIRSMLEEFKKQAPKVAAVKYPKGNGCLLELSIYDLHFGKLCWEPEAGENYDVKIAQSGFSDALEALLQRAKGFPVSRILFPVGNDFFNVDNAANETTHGTPQREDGRWQKSFVLGRKMMVDAIHRLRKIAPVDVVMIPGNHDMERVFYLGDTLSGWFSKTPGVRIDNSPMVRKYYTYGKCLLGFTHGKEEKHKDLPLIMATESPDWSTAKFREIHVGHWHHKKDIFFLPSDEHNGIRVRLIPSLCPSDDWHRLKGFNGLRAAEAYLWDADQGGIGSFSFTP